MSVFPKLHGTTRLYFAAGCRSNADQNHGIDEHEQNFVIHSSINNSQAIQNILEAV